MKLWSLTLERVRLLENELEAKTEEMAILKVYTVIQTQLDFIGKDHFSKI